MNKKNGEEKVKLSRIARIDAEIRSETFPNSEELAAKLEVSPRTILRDIEYLKDFYNAPITYNFSKRGFYYTEPNFFIRSVMLSKEELKTITLYDQFSKFTAREDSEAIEKTYYHNQHIRQCEDGTVTVSFRSTQLYGVFHWVLREGHKVMVLNPPELVDMVKREARKVVRYYV